MSNELSERVCRKMGIEPIHWIVTCTDEDGTPYRGMFKEPKWFESLRQSKDFTSTPAYPNLLTDEWAGKLLAMLAARGIKKVELKWYDDGEVHCLICKHPWLCGSRTISDGFEDVAKTLAEAVCRAIDAMPEGA